MLKGLRATVIWILVIFVTFLSVTISIDRYVTFVTKNSIVDTQAARDLQPRAIIVLGAAVRPDGSLSPMLQDRLDKGFELYQAGVANKVIVSGDHGQDHYDEPGHMKEYLVKRGIPENDVFEDHAGFSTYDTVYRAQAIFDASPAVFVTQRYHLYRTLFTAHQLGLPAVGVACDTREYAGQSQRDMREILARVKDFFLVTYDATPIYLGDKIDLDGPASQTDDGKALVPAQ